MRTIEVLQIVGALCAAFGSLASRVDGRVVKRLRESNARSPRTAIEITCTRFMRWRLSRLHAAGVVRSVGDSGFYLDEAAYAAHRRTKKKRVLALVTIVVAAALILLAVL